MKNARCFLCLSMAAGLLVSFLGSSSWAQAADGRFLLGYYRLGLLGADNTLRLVNDGASSGFTLDPTGTLCANIYVFDSSQHMLDCCSCAVSANGILTLSVTNNLLGSPTSVNAGTSGVIKVVSSLELAGGPVCAASSGYVVSPEFVGWLSHYPGTPITATLTEEELERGRLNPAELSSLQSRCGQETVRRCTCPGVLP